MKEVKHVKIRKNMKLNEFLKELENSMGGRKIQEAIQVYREMHKDKDCKIFFGLAGAMVPGGMKKIIVDLLDNGYIDVFVTTGANLTHDLIESLGQKHYIGTDKVDDNELNKKGIDRIYNVFMKNEVYGKLEDFFNKNFDKLKDKKTVNEFLWELGKLSSRDSILNTCYRKKIPIFCPALSDSGIGLMVWNNLMKKKECKVLMFEDLKEILDIAWTSKKTGVVYIGGGVPKNYIQQAMQFSKGALYGIQVTMDRIESGGSSGAELRESISWGKLNKNAKFVDIRLDATIVLPLLYAGLLLEK
ncbi:MAG: deoxyhypusine synthase [archaeon]